MNYASIPGEMKALPNWILYRLEDRGGEKPTKVPYTVGGPCAKTNDPSTWATFDAALAAFQKGGYAGLGFVFTGTPYVGIDIDGCVDPANGKASPEAQDAVRILTSYTELSQSRKGLHIIVKGTLPAGRRRNGAFEMYGEGSPRYFAMTGDVWDGLSVIRESQAAIDEVHRKYIQPEEKARSVTKAAAAPTRAPQMQPAGDGDEQLLAKACRTDADFEALYRGIWKERFRSQSEADMSLANRLAFWCGRDTVRMDRLFRQSGLYRDKWDRVQSGSTYGRLTLEKASAECWSVYNPHYSNSEAEDDSTASGYVGNDLLTYKPNDYSDAGNAAVFARFVEGKLIWTDGNGFLYWNGLMWELNEHAAIGYGIAFTDRMLDEARRQLIDARINLSNIQASGDAAALADAKAAEAQADKYLAFAVKTRSRQRIEAFVTLSKPELLIPGEKLNADPFLLNTPAGMVNLKTGKATPHDASAYCTAITAVSASDQGDELWNNHLRTITEDDPDLMRFHQEAAGMALVGRVYCENLLIALGGGRNGKSTHYNVQLSVLGPGYAGTINPEVLTTDKRNAGADLATLKGKRFIVAGELEEGKRLSTSVMKRLTSTDPITAERKYFDPETFTPTHSTVLYTNHMPRLGSTDNGTKRRIKVVPFSAVISDSAERKNYTQYLFENAGGAILSWMLEGARMFIANGFQLSPCSAVEEATGQYFEQNDWLGQFLDECCIIEPGRKCSGSALYRAYAKRASDDGEYVRPNNVFAMELEKIGFSKQKTRTGAIWHGLDLRANWQAERYYAS